MGAFFREWLNCEGTSNYVLRGMISIVLNKFEFMILIIVLLGYSQDVSRTIAQNEMLMMKMVRLF